MILMDNINYLLKQHGKDLRELIHFHENKLYSVLVEEEEASSGDVTLVIRKGEKRYYIHSSNNPIKEAECLISLYYEKISSYNHVMFYGGGIGYHIDEFIKRFPDKTFSIYEPVNEILLKLLSIRKIEDFPVNKMMNFYIEEAPQSIIENLQHFAKTVDEKALVIVLPAYKKFFKENYNSFVNKFNEISKRYSSFTNVNLAFEKRWVLNSLINFPNVINTPNIFYSKEKDYFKDKPVVLVSAGPSLDQEIENLRYIKEKKLAYIFTVGSSINALIENEIYPDAACTYDPSSLNQKVFAKVIEKQIDSIPLIFGSSVGFEIIRNYQGPKIHMVTNQDPISNYYLKTVDDNQIIKVNDAPSIAVIAMQMLGKLKFNPIILVGQNLSYKDKKHYSKDITYDSTLMANIERRLKSSEDENIQIDSVDGKKVLTNPSFLTIKTLIENYSIYFANNYSLKVINTTKNGAKIENTIYKELEDVISEDLTESIDVEIEQNLLKTCYDYDFLKTRRESMNRSFGEFVELINGIKKLLHSMTKKKTIKQLAPILTKFDKANKRFLSNDFLNVFIQPMIRVEFDVYLKRRDEIKLEMDPQQRVEKILNSFGKIVFLSEQLVNEYGRLYKALDKNIEAKIKNNQY